MSAALKQTSLALMGDDTPALIVLGRDESNKAHASWFTQDEATAATAAAELMGMMVLAVTADDVRLLANQLPHGKIFGSGKAFVPFTKQTMFDALIEHVPLSQQVRPLRIVRASAADTGDSNSPDKPTPPTPGNRAPSPSVPSDWGKIIPGSVVLARSSVDEGWWEAVIITAEAGQQFRLRWRDYPEEGNVIRPLKHIALRHPSLQPHD